MKKSVKQLLSSFLVIIMLVGVVPFAGLGITASAAETYSGTCGENLMWTLTNDNRLVISGVGEMYDYDSELDCPWVIYNTLIEEVILEDGVTSIDGDAFVNYDKLKTVTIGKDIVCLEDVAGYSVFWNSDTVENITVSSENKVYSSDSNGVLYNKDKTRIIQYPAGKINTSFAMPESVTEISRNAFYNAVNLTDITMSSNITYIGSGAFSGTGMLADDNNWEDDVLYIDSYLIDARANGDYKVKEGTLLIAEDAFYYNHSLKSVTLPESVRYINDDAFFFTSIERIIVDEENPYYCNGTYGDLYNKDKTELIRYPDANVQNQVFIPEGVKKIADGAFSWVKCISTVILPDSVEIIEPYTFCYSSLRDLTLGDGVKTIGEGAFDCCGIESITIGRNVETIEQYAFGGCVGPTNVYFNGTETEWNDISIEEGNECLLNATIHFLGEEECDHSYTSTVTIEPTYTTEGEITYTCEKCGDTYTEIIPVVPYPENADAVLSLKLIEETDTHVLLGVQIIKGCIAALDIGVYQQSGLIGQCSDMYFSEYVDRLMDMKLAAAACNKYTGLAAYAKDGGFDAGEYILFAEFEKTSDKKVTENDFVLGVSNCCDPSITKLNCSVVYDFSSNHKHEYTSEVTKKQTCTEDGLITYTCSCGDSYTEIIPKAHNYNHISVSSTCTVTGMEYDICSDCGEVINSKVLPLAPHSWSEWKIVREATADLEGIKERSCTVCGTTEEEFIPKLNVIVDDESGISIEFNDEYDSGVEIKVEEVFDGDSFQILDLYHGNNQSVIFDITTVKDGEKVQPDGKVKVRIPLPAGFDTTKLFVCYVDSTNGTVTPIPATVVNGYVEFETDHFSYYAIVEKLGKVNSVSIDDISMSYKDSVTITPNINVDAGVDYNVTYSSSNTDVVSIDANGKLTTNDKGSATITVTVTDEYGNTVTDTCKVNVSYKWWQWIIVIVLFGWIWY